MSDAYLIRNRRNQRTIKALTEAQEILQHDYEHSQRVIKALTEALEAARLLFAKDHAIDRFNWRKSPLRAQDICELNELLFQIDVALALAKEGE